MAILYLICNFSSVDTGGEFHFQELVVLMPGNLNIMFAFYLFIKGFFSSSKTTKNLDPSNKMDLDFLNSFFLFFFFFEENIIWI